MTQILSRHVLRGTVSTVIITTVFEGPENQVFALRTLLIANTDSTDLTTSFGVSITVTTVDGTTVGLMTLGGVPAQDTLSWDPDGSFYIMPGEKLSLLSSGTASELTYHISMDAIGRAG